MWRIRKPWTLKVWYLGGSLTSNTARAYGWPSLSLEDRMTLRWAPFKSTLQIKCSFESTQYKRLPTTSAFRGTTLQSISSALMIHKECIKLNRFRLYLYLFSYSINNRREFLPSVIPLGHSMSSDTSTCRSTPFMPAFSILALMPQSDQYMNLWKQSIKKHKVKTQNLDMDFFFIIYKCNSYMHDLNSPLL